MSADPLNSVKSAIAPAEEAGPREKISAFVITFNEEKNIDECLASLDFCDEIVVVDSYSTDSTVAKASAAGAVILNRAFGPRRH